MGENSNSNQNEQHGSGLSVKILESQGVYCLLDFLELEELIRFQALRRKLYHEVVPKYCANGSRKHSLATFLIPE